MKLLSPDGTELLRVEGLHRHGNELMIRGRAFGTMPITARLGPEEARKLLKMMDFKLIVFLLSMPFRRSR